MLRINGKKIGDVVEVTFVKSFFGVQAQERINDRCVLLEARYRAQPGDRCRVKILWDKIPGVLLVGIESIVYKGDGKQSPLQLVLDQIRSGPRGYGYLFQGWVFVLLDAIFHKDRQRILECLLDVLEYYKLEETNLEPPVQYALFGLEIKRLIATLCGVSYDRKTEYFLRAADYCSARKEGLQVAYEMACEACACAHGPENSSLQTAAQAEFRRLKSIIVRDFEQRLADTRKDDLQFAVRLALANFKLQGATDDEAREVIALVEPVYDQLRWTDYFPEVARLLSQAFFMLGHAQEGKFWANLSENRVAHRRLVTSLDPLLEIYMRMSPEFKRRINKNRSATEENS